MKERYYLDYNIYEKIRREKIKINDDFFKSKDLFLSVAHIEEYYKAHKNNKNNENVESLQELKKLMINISKKGVILNPCKNSSIHAKPEAFDECYDIIQKYDTRNIVEDNGKTINKFEKEKVMNLREQDKMANYNSTLSIEDIWQRPEVLNGISEFHNFYKKYSMIIMRSLVSVYGLQEAKQAIPFLPNDFELRQNCFKNIMPNFKLLECVMEYLHNLLSGCGFHRDTDVRKTISGIHDVSHSIYATYCNYFVTTDYKFKKRVEAIYFYLGLDTKPLQFEELVKKGFVKNQGYDT